MALLDEGMPCAICGAPIVNIDTADIFAMAYFGIRDYRFQRLDDAAMHQHCIDTWEHRDAFIAYYNLKIRDELSISEDGHVVKRPNYTLYDSFARSPLWSWLRKS